MKYFPLFAQLKQRSVLVVGGGHVALRKITTLLNAKAQIQLVAQQLHPEIQHWVDEKKITWIAKNFSPEQLDNVYLVIATTNDHSLNQYIAQQADKKYRLCNVVDHPALCSYISPSIIDRGDLQIAISTGGKAPVLARLWREKLEAFLPQNLATMTQISGQWRTKVKATFPHLTQRRRFWENLFSHPTFFRHCEQQQHQQAHDFIEHLLQEPIPLQGEVTLVGAGPGDPDLLTLKGLRYIQQADIILYDALVSEEILQLVRRDAQQVFVGKRVANHNKRQEEINALLVEYAQAGKRVVRLKGGDPFVFGRGGEEIESLVQAHIPFSVIPGITAGVGVTAYAGIPLTHRDFAQSATFITGHHKTQGKELDWKTLAMSHHTLVIYMGSLKAKEIAATLIQHGRKPETPVAIISNGTRAEQSVKTGHLSSLSSLAENAPRPALIVIGEVVALQNTLHWFH